MRNRSVLILFPLIAMCCCTARADDAVSHQFRYKPDADATFKSLNLAGEFNGWSTPATPMTKQDDGTYVATVKLAPGKHFYKFVMDGTKWINDPAADKSLETDDGQQGKNSGVMISATDAPPVSPDALGHTFSYRPPENTAPKSVNLAGEFNGWNTTSIQMQRGDDGTYTTTQKLKPGVYHYKFVVDGTQWLNDPNAEKSLEQEDGNGGKNSGVEIKPPTTEPAK